MERQRIEILLKFYKHVISDQRSKRKRFGKEPNKRMNRWEVELLRHTFFILEFTEDMCKIIKNGNKNSFPLSI